MDIVLQAHRSLINCEKRFGNPSGIQRLLVRNPDTDHEDASPFYELEEWREWMNRFEQLLAALDYFSAVTHYNSEESSKNMQVSYVRVDGEFEKTVKEFED